MGDNKPKAQSFSQSFMRSDPIAGSLGHPDIKEKKKPLIIWYPDPDTMKLDDEINHSEDSLKYVEARMGKKMVLDEWDDPEPIAMIRKEENKAE